MLRPVRRTFTLPLSLWENALEIAQLRGESLAAIIRKSLSAYIAANKDIRQKPEYMEETDMSEVNVTLSDESRNVK